jgi:signal transduction histidine kinase
MEPGEVLPSLVATMHDALKLSYAAVALRRDEGLVVAASAGQLVGEPLALPLSYQGAEVGQLIVGPRAAGEPWSPADRRLLADLAHHAGVVAHGVRVMAELQRAREQLVLAREEERRRLRNDLHDGLGPSLAALALTAAAVGELIARDPDAAERAAAQLQRAIRASVADVRRLVYDLRPPTLDELGLVEAIREQAARLGVQAPGPGDALAGLRIELDAPAPLPALPAAVEVAAFRLAQEALANVARHAHARSCVVRLTCVAGRALEVEIEDDGVGIPPERRAGVGLHSMRERAAELGGVCVIERARQGGTRVAAWLPLDGGGSIQAEGDHGDTSRPARR